MKQSENPVQASDLEEYVGDAGAWQAIVEGLPDGLDGRRGRGAKRSDGQPGLVQPHVGQVAGPGALCNRGCGLFQSSATLAEMIVEPGRDSEGQRPRRFQRFEGGPRQEVVVEGAVTPGAGHPDIAGAQALAQLGEGAKLVARAVDPGLGQHERPPAPGHEPHWRRLGKLPLAVCMGRTDHVERRQEVLHGARPFEGERLQQARPELAHALMARHQRGRGIDQLRRCKRLGVGDRGLESGPAHLGLDSLVEIRPGLCRPRLMRGPNRRRQTQATPWVITFF